MYRESKSPFCVITIVFDGRIRIDRVVDWIYRNDYLSEYWTETEHEIRLDFGRLIHDNNLNAICLLRYAGELVSAVEFSLLSIDTFAHLKYGDKCESNVFIKFFGEFFLNFALQK